MSNEYPIVEVLEDLAKHAAGKMTAWEESFVQSCMEQESWSPKQLDVIRRLEDKFL